jgi:hypothetical protein
LGSGAVSERLAVLRELCGSFFAAFAREVTGTGAMKLHHCRILI